MQVVVQNGAQHGLARRSVEQMLGLFPSDWSRKVKSIALCGGPDLRASFHAKECVLSLSWPTRPPLPTTAEAVEVLVGALAAVSELGALPKRFSPASFIAKSEVVATIRDQCIQAVGRSAA